MKKRQKVVHACPLFNVVAEIATTGKQTKQIKGKKKLEKKKMKRKRKIPRHNKTNLLVSHLQTL